METVTDSIFLGSKITADGDCSHEIKRHLLLGRKIMTNLDSILEGNGNPLQCSCLEYPMDGGAWWAVVHEVAKSWTWLSDFTFTFHFYALEKEMATHSSVLAWRIPGIGEPGGLPSMGSHRVGHDWSDLAAADSILKGSHYFADQGLSSQSYGFSSSHVWILDSKESRVLKNWCFWTVVLEKNLESPLDCKEIQPVQPKGNQSWIFIGRTDGWSWNSNTLATWCEELTHWKRLWCWGRLKVGGEGDDRGWDGWMASLTLWTWVWVSSGNWWWTGKVAWGHKESDTTEWLNWTELNGDFFPSAWQINTWEDKGSSFRGPSPRLAQ